MQEYPLEEAHTTYPWESSSRHYGRLAPKSGLAIYRSIGVLAGVVDQDYRGEVFVLLVDHDDKLSYLVKPEDKIVQLILEKATIARLQEVDTFD